MLSIDGPFQLYMSTKPFCWSLPLLDLELMLHFSLNTIHGTVRDESRAGIFLPLRLVF
jgi:hypothetical protein